MNQNSCFRFLAPLLGSLIIGILFIPGESDAIPAFSRKYKTSCVTCHALFPKLTPFGEAFRLNGFRMSEADEEKVKEEPVSLGSQAYKRVWPDAVWPGTIPGSSPVSFRVRSGLTYADNEEGQRTEFLEPALQVMMAGTFDENISFFVGAHLFENGESGSIDRLYLKFNDLLTSVLPEHALYVRVGQFVPDLTTYITNHRSLTNTAYAINTYAPSMGSSLGAGHAHGSAPFGIESFQLGAEASGIINHRFRYVAGVVNGNSVHGENNSDKDVYGKIAYKAGGMAFDGTSKGDPFGAGAKNWAERSVVVSVFGYAGSTVESNVNVAIERLGGDVSLTLRDLNLVSGFIVGSDEELHEGEIHEDSYSLLFVEANQMIYPWLVGVLRYEEVSPDELDSIRRIIPHVSALYTANIRFSIETRLDPDDAEFTNLFVGMDFAF